MNARITVKVVNRQFGKTMVTTINNKITKVENICYRKQTN